MAVHLPGPRGFRHLACGREFVNNPYRTLVELNREFGSIFALGIPPFRVVYLIGPEANRLIMADQPNIFHWGSAYGQLEPLGGPAALIVSDGDDHRRRRTTVQAFLHKSMIESHFGLIQTEIDEVLNQWSPGETRDIYAEVRSAILRIMCETIGGIGLRRHASSLEDNLQVMLNFANRWPWEQVRLNVIGSPWRRVISSRSAIDTLVYGEIANRRRSGYRASDMLTVLLEARSRNELLTDEEIRDLVVSLITAGFDTSSAAIGWAVQAMLLHPEVWDSAAAETVHVLGTRRVQLDDIPHLTYLGWVVHETLRLYSPAVLGVRRNVAPFEFSGFQVEKGALIAYSPYVTHRLPELWRDPDQFLPTRWATGNGILNRAMPFSYVPFGGGARRCPGEPFARVEITILLCQILRRARLSPVLDDLTPTGMSAMHPKEGVPVRIESLSRTQ